LHTPPALLRNKALILASIPDSQSIPYVKLAWIGA